MQNLFMNFYLLSFFLYFFFRFNQKIKNFSVKKSKNYKNYFFLQTLNEKEKKIKQEKSHFFWKFQFFLLNLNYYFFFNFLLII